MFSRIATLATLLVLVACGPQKAQPSGGPFFNTPDGGSSTAATAACMPSRSSEPLVPRVDLTGMSASAAGGRDVAYTSDLMGSFYSICGSCHVDSVQGGRSIKKNDVDAFIASFDETWLAPVQLDDPARYMPRPGKPWSMRAAGDSVYDFVSNAKAWLAAGKPRTVFALDGAGSGGGVVSPQANYTFTAAVAAAMTNIGNCVPTSALFASSTSGIMTSMDDLFSGAQALPRTLAETDLTSLDSEELARTGVIAYAPTYALWSAGSGKLRHIRVPRGTSVHFDKDTQTFDIPDNTRFYKTFLRAVRDRTGHTTWRKMETRVIVARADTTDAATGEAHQNALFGTYIWSEDEITATLATQPYRDQTPWADIIRTYITDELLYQNILDTTTGSVDGAVAHAIRDNKHDPAYRDLLQHYAIPGRVRCVQCHMGSPTKDFVLGFIPLQVARRATGAGGTYDATGADELNQLQRLVDVGVITGVTSPSDVKPLEESQGARKPRKTATAQGAELTEDGELEAQAYILGNCAHCHNPRGFPSMSKPELTTALNFLPDDKDGGIFEFPFDKMSPLRSRGAANDIPIPYITPSLRDYPVTVEGGERRIDNDKSLINGENGAITYTPKSAPNGLESCAEVPLGDKESAAFCGDRKTGPPVVAAPWRSLIYRNVDTPAAYFDDFVPFPHMPMNTAGFDCRVPRIMGDWMVGLPSIRKLVHLSRLLSQVGLEAPSEDALPTKSGRAPVLGSLDTGYDDNPQPYMEVRPDSDVYAQALADARARLVEYHDSVRYQYCQDVLSPDIYDPFVATNPKYPYPYHPNPYQYQLTYVENPPDDPHHPDRYVQPRIGVPFHAHWIDNDPSEPAGDWTPRRTRWKEIFVDGQRDTELPVGATPLEILEMGTEDDVIQAAKFRRDRELLAETLTKTQLTDDLFRYATTEVPFGRWKVKPECEQKLASRRKISDPEFMASPPDWFSVVKPAANTPVYMLSPGGAVYRHICINCHGPNADGRGLQVDLLAASSEGEARPANFKQGLFGPSSNPLSNLHKAFDFTASGDDALAELWAPRYMAWMALGGTLKRIPQDIIQLVANTPTLGIPRPGLSNLPGANDATGNMLNLAKGLCADILPSPIDGVPSFERARDYPPSEGYPPFNSRQTHLIQDNYDKQMWAHLCSDFSPQVIRVYARQTGSIGVVLVAFYYAQDPLNRVEPGKTYSYPPKAPVLDHRGDLQPSVDRSNLYPACMDASAAITGTRMPLCPPEFLRDGTVLWKGVNQQYDPASYALYERNVEAWKLRGGIATGMAVFSYLKSRLTDPAQSRLPPYYDQCELLP